MQDLHFDIHILIVCEPGNGLAEMLTGYLYHYTMDRATVSHYPEHREIPAPAEKVLQEDGIHRWEQRPPVAGADTLMIRINHADKPSISATMASGIEFHFSLPIEQMPSVDTYRTLREEIKRLAISVIGSRQPAFSK